MNDDLFTRLRALKEACGSNKNDSAIALITACIGEGIDTRPQIIGTLKHLDYNPRHVGMMLNNNEGSLPSLHRWMRDADGCYRLHDTS